MSVYEIIKPIFESFDGKGEIEVGEVFWTPVPYVETSPRILTVSRSSPSDHESVNFELAQVGSQHYRGERNLPLAKLSLASNEELMATKSKRRPCIVLATGALTHDQYQALPEGTQRKLARSLTLSSYLVAPLFSCSTMQNPGTFGPELSSRIAKLEYPHFFSVPDFRNLKAHEPRSIARFDSVFSSRLGLGSERTGIRLTETAKALFVHCFWEYVSEEEHQDVLELRQLFDD